MATLNDDSDISDIEVVQAFADYERRHRDGAMGWQESPSETLLRKGGRLALEVQRKSAKAGRGANTT